MILVFYSISTLLCIVLGAKNVVWSRGKAWGVYGRKFMLRFSKLGSNPNTYRMYAIQRQFNHDHVNSFSSKEKKKTIKKAS